MKPFFTAFSTVDGFSFFSKRNRANRFSQLNVATVTAGMTVPPIISDVHENHGGNLHRRVGE
jgi:hypothetical protein